MSHKLTFTVQAPEVTEKGRGHPLNPKHCREPSSNIRSTTLTSMAMSRAARKRAGVVHISNICPQMPTVDADDSEVAAVLSTLVSQCGDGNAMTTSTKFNTFVALQQTRCRRSSRLLQFFRSENYQPDSPSSHIAHKPPAKQVNFLKLACASNSRSCRASNFE
jgi:hypothetical protein